MTHPCSGCMQRCLATPFCSFAGSCLGPTLVQHGADNVIAVKDCSPGIPATFSVPKSLDWVLPSLGFQDWKTGRKLRNWLIKSSWTVINSTHTHPFNGPFSGTTRVSRYQKGKTSLVFTEARDSEWQWHQLGCMQVYTSLQTDNHANNPPLSFLQVGCPSCCPTNSVKALKATHSIQPRVNQQT